MMRTKYALRIAFSTYTVKKLNNHVECRPIGEQYRSNVANALKKYRFSPCFQNEPNIKTKRI